MVSEPPRKTSVAGGRKQETERAEQLDKDPGAPQRPTGIGGRKAERGSWGKDHPPTPASLASSGFAGSRGS